MRRLKYQKFYQVIKTTSSFFDNWCYLKIDYQTSYKILQVNENDPISESTFDIDYFGHQRVTLKVGSLREEWEILDEDKQIIWKNTD